MNFIAKNARLGDGILLFRGKNACLSMQSINLDWLTVKRDICLLDGFQPGHITLKKSGYTGRSNIYSFDTKVHPAITTVYNVPFSDILTTLTVQDLIFWYLDDGSYHVRRHTMHLYCNSLDNAQAETLIDRISALYGIAPTLRLDKKPSGRAFPYLYFPRQLVEVFRLDVEVLLHKYKVKSLFYKIGEPQPLRCIRRKDGVRT